ncbi:hypothetical protein DERP_008792 [Dermatophagoides pteronyssinus]|uniref:Uncharacterized protein n=1 Tax=Dermatophagoides pteronyssinus TaxID=6956 RepID=A0ABQ8IWM5_DERPT|nr:hypothetical protein DERP_008792 [Dermatophagoides pteronyssinus]
MKRKHRKKNYNVCENFLQLQPNQLFQNDRFFTNFFLALTFSLSLSLSSLLLLPTCNPTLIFLVNAPSGKIACTCGTTVELSIPPSGPIACTSCRIRVMIAKYCGKSVVNIPFKTSSTASSVASNVCSRHVSPLSLRNITISRSLPRNDAKCGTSIMTGLCENKTKTKKTGQSLMRKYKKQKSQ